MYSEALGVLKKMIRIENISKDLGEFFLRDVTLNINEGEYFVILGPTGAGKTILLETIAGIYRPDSGRIILDDRDITGIPPRERSIGMVYQDYILFPFLTVEENIGFGLKSRKMGKGEIKRKVDELANLLGVSHLSHRYPATLSGGEQQKVAIARAIAIEPRVLLLDEPLSALDSRTRDYLREELKRVKEEFGITMIHVTHDQTEALVLADRIAVMMQGRIMQVGTPHEVFNKPLNNDLADFVGVENILSGVVRNNEDGVADIEIADIGSNIFAVSEYHAGDAVKVFLRPEEIILSRHKEDSTARNDIKGRINELHDIGPLTRVQMDTGLVALITKRSRESLGLQIGNEVYATFKATLVHVVRG
ncbi:molybdate/tungstate transport system ATP-binding protein [Candidatus Methanophagaceae archaeon]|nr:molybdate/tungstate transport system ATP-binding protein [Methanophagales archaeon]